MQIPENPALRETLHGTGRNGYAIYCYANETTGVRLRAVRQRRGQAFVEQWYHDLLPDKLYANYTELRSALQALSEQSIVLTRALYPFVRGIQPVRPEHDLSNRCRLCARDEATGQGVPATVWLTLATNWHAGDDRLVFLCERHREEYAGEPAALLAALRTEAEQRAARRAAAAGSSAAAAAEASAYMVGAGSQQSADSEGGEP